MAGEEWREGEAHAPSCVLGEPSINLVGATSFDVETFIGA